MTLRRPLRWAALSSLAACFRRGLGVVCLRAEDGEPSDNGSPMGEKPNAEAADPWYRAAVYQTLRDLHQRFAHAERNKRLSPLPRTEEEAARQAAYWALDAVVYLLDRTEAGDPCFSHVQMQSSRPGWFLVEVSIEGMGEKS